jgi:hypothetical protein
MAGNYFLLVVGPHVFLSSSNFTYSDTVIFPGLLYYMFADATLFNDYYFWPYTSSVGLVGSRVSNLSTYTFQSDIKVVELPASNRGPLLYATITEGGIIFSLAVCVGAQVRSQCKSKKEETQRLIQ